MRASVSMTSGIAACPSKAAQGSRGWSGLAWLGAALFLCPCHMPLTLALVAALFSGTAFGAFLAGHSYLAVGIIVVTWGWATWRGIRYLRAVDDADLSLIANGSGEKS